MILNCFSMRELGLPERYTRAATVSPYGEALVFVKTADLVALGIHLPGNPGANSILDASHPSCNEATPVWVRIVEKCEDGSFLGFQTDLRSRPFGIKASADQLVKFYSRKTLVAA